MSSSIANVQFLRRLVGCFILTTAIAGVAVLVVGGSAGSSWRSSWRWPAGVSDGAAPSCWRPNSTDPSLWSSNISH
jgi:hypothetical protein